MANDAIDKFESMNFVNLIQSEVLKLIMTVFQYRILAGFLNIQSPLALSLTVI